MPENLSESLPNSLPEWLRDGLSNGSDISLGALAGRLAIAFLLGCVVAGIYAVTQRRPRDQTMSFVATLVLLTVLIAMVTLVIGNSVARAFSLVGALAIVRFRTVVEDTRDTAFVIFAVVVGMAVGADFLAVPLFGIPVVALAALLFRPPSAATADGPDATLVIRVGIGHDPEALFQEVFGKHLRCCRLTATATARQGAALELTYAVRLCDDKAAVPLVAALNGLEGVQSVELRKL